MTPLDRVRALALALPDTTERESDGQVIFFVADQPFAQIRDGHQAGGHQGDGRLVVCVRTGDPDEQATLIDAAPSLYSPAAPVDGANWVAINPADEADWTAVEDRIARSWELVAPAGLLEAGGR